VLVGERGAEYHRPVRLRQGERLEPRAPPEPMGVPFLNVLIADKLEQSGIDGIRALGCSVTADAAVAPEAIGAAIAASGAQVLIVRGKKVPAAAIKEAKGLRLIVRAGAGYDTIDVAAASAAGIAVCNCPGMNAVAVAELAMGLLLACDRRIPEETASLRAGLWNKKEFSKARGIKGSTLGIVGVGSIGREVIKRALAFDMKVIAWSRGLTAGAAKDLGVAFGGNDRAALLAMLPGCDAVSVHVAGNDQTKRMCDAQFFGAMKKGAYFINTTRGSVVDEAALRQAIAEKGLRAGLDVFEDEPAAAEGAWECPTVKLPGVAATHHVGASTDQAQEAVAAETVRIVKVFKETGRFENCVNATALK
jgi:D-3-phosphoglycerate dehydrogenase